MPAWPDKLMRYLCIHGHFYQPPRENPWLEAIEVQDSAYPYHDWNERINAECYAPNGCSRILDAENRIAKIQNNYAWISVDFGPTLLSWLKDKAPDTYRDILAADFASSGRFSGHGSAMAQCYNHMIMPLANSRDKLTQVIWGIEDFRYRYGRNPEGMWLPETAVDLETLEILAQQGIRFTVLAPSQAKSMDGEDVTGIDPTRAYLLKLASGSTINLFFYDGPISRAVAFEGLLNNGERFARRLLDAFSDQRDWPQLANIATDGETYGHHHAHGDMALAYALDYIHLNGLAKITTYGEYLEHNPPTHEVEILENTAWSCVHGVGRWSANCGCNSGGRADWNQEWRAPLREALDWLRDEIAPRYETTAIRFLKKPWAARNDYIHVILDRSLESRERFATRHFRRKDLSRSDRVTVWKLLEMQRHSMLMYTSCGWFFDELSGIETVQVMQYAGRAVQLAQDVFGDSLEEQFLEKLSLAKSNVAEHGDGAEVYRKFVKPAMLDFSKLAAHYAISSLFETYPDSTRVYAYSVDTKDYRAREAGEARMAVGKARFTSEIIQDSEMLVFGVLHLGGHNLNGSVAKFFSDEQYRELAKVMREAFTQGIPEAIGLLGQRFGGQVYSIKNLFKDEQRKVVAEILKPTLDRMDSFDRELYKNEALLLRFMRSCYVPMPKELKVAAEFALNSLLRRALADPVLDLNQVQNLIDDARLIDTSLDQATLEVTLRRNLERKAEAFAANWRDLGGLREFREFAARAKSVPLPLVLWSVQNRCWEILQKYYPEMKQNGESEWTAEFEQLAELLALRVQ
jgi:alpha-amylase/alpha-mannosidase (GH57 family)